MTNNGWFAVQVYTGKEKWVSAALEERGHDPLLLLYTETHQWSDRRMRVERAVFPGYVFCRVDPRQRTSVLSVPGVLRIVGVGRKPIPLEVDEVSSLLQIADSGHRVSPAPFLRTGERVVIRGGALDGVVGRLIHFRNGLRVAVSVSLLERAVSLEVDISRLERLASGGSVPDVARGTVQSVAPAEAGGLWPVKRYKAALAVSTTHPNSEGAAGNTHPRSNTAVPL
jgi:transcription antitermination factor NusG